MTEIDKLLAATMRVKRRHLEVIERSNQYKEISKINRNVMVINIIEAILKDALEPKNAQEHED